MDAAVTMNSRSTSIFSTDKCSTDGPLPNSQPNERMESGIVIIINLIPYIYILCGKLPQKHKIGYKIFRTGSGRSDSGSGELIR
jgi:hypothetical protein